MAYDTLELAQARILELEEQVTELTTERDSLSQNNSELSATCENLRTENQKYFNKLIAQYNRDDNDKDDETETVPTCEEFAKTLTI